MLNKKQIIWAVAMLTLPLWNGAGLLHAQNGINTPYSRYGFGIMADRSMGFNKAMGGISQGMRDGQQINVGNPASYSAVDSLTALFDLGFSIGNANFDMGNMKQNAKNSSFDYFAFQFRAWRHVGITAGIRPYTNIKYDFSSQATPVSGNSTLTSSSAFSGDGGLHQVFIGAGWEMFKGFSVGANVAYLYGDYTHTSTTPFSDGNAFSMQRSYSADIATYKLDFGLQYSRPLSKKDELTVGFTYGLGHDINNRAKRTTTKLYSSGSEQTVEEIKNAFSLPHSFDVGIGYRHAQKWRVGTDFSLEKWSQARFPSQSTDDPSAYVSTKGQLYDRMRLSLGGEYTPNPYGRFFQRISYRAGGYYSQSYARADLTGKVSGKPLEYGLSAGMSIPIRSVHIWRNEQHAPRLNIGFHWVHCDIPYLSQQSGNKNTLKENYLRVSIGLTFSEHWFFKWKVQ